MNVNDITNEIVGAIKGVLGAKLSPNCERNIRGKIETILSESVPTAKKAKKSVDPIDSGGLFGIGSRGSGND